jgi:hypothetical protein
VRCGFAIVRLVGLVYSPGCGGVGGALTATTTTGAVPIGMGAGGRSRRLACGRSRTDWAARSNGKDRKSNARPGHRRPAPASMSKSRSASWPKSDRTQRARPATLSQAQMFLCPSCCDLLAMAPGPQRDQRCPRLSTSKLARLFLRWRVPGLAKAVFRPSLVLTCYPIESMVLSAATRRNRHVVTKRHANCSKINGLDAQTANMRQRPACYRPRRPTGTRRTRLAGFERG